MTSSSTKLLHNCVSRFPDIVKILGTTQEQILSYVHLKPTSYSRVYPPDRENTFLMSDYPEDKDDRPSEKSDIEKDLGSLRRSWKSNFDYALSLLMGIDLYIFLNILDIRFQKPAVLDEVEAILLGLDGKKSLRLQHSREGCNQPLERLPIDFYNGIGFVNAYQRLKLEELMNDQYAFTEYDSEVFEYKVGILSSARRKYGMWFENCFTVSSPFTLFNLLKSRSGHKLMKLSKGNFYIARNTDADGFSSIDEGFSFINNCIMCDFIEQHFSNMITDFSKYTPLMKEMLAILDKIAYDHEQTTFNILLFVGSEKEASYAKKFMHENPFRVNWAYAWVEYHYEKSILVIEHNSTRTNYLT